MDCKKLLYGLFFLMPALGTAQEDSVRNNKLDEVHITDDRGDFGHMYQVDGMKITAGKKSEVVNVEKLIVNKSTNNTRQVYAKVAGLNIFENDGSGLQLSIGGRGLDPNRTSNFNVRQNGYDISADALGYPESYYTPPTEALAKIEILKGAAGLQYGTQFGGLLNFEIKQPGADKPFSIESRQTGGSWGYFGSFNAISGTKGKLKYYAFAQYKRGNGWRPNSEFESFNGYADVHYHINEKHMVGIEYTRMQYLAQQAGGLTDKMFEEDQRQSNRERNWFSVEWNVLDLEWDYRISHRTRVQTRLYSLVASRDAIGFRNNRVAVEDPGGKRDLLKGTFNNTALESRLLHRYTMGDKQQVLLAGIRAYKGYSTNLQAYTDNGDGANFDLAPGKETNANNEIASDYTFPNLNLAAFAEHIFRINRNWTVTPGVRVEHIRTEAEGYYVERVRDLRDSIVSENSYDENRNLPRTFVIGGLGTSYRLHPNWELYGNFSQNYRSVTFNDIRVVNPSFRIDPNIKDETGWSADMGTRGKVFGISYDVSAFYLYYDNRIGEVFKKNDRGQVIRERGNIGTAQIYGLESYVEFDVLQMCELSGQCGLIDYAPEKYGLSIYSNLALTQGTYTKSPYGNVEGKHVEYVPMINWKAGVQAKYKKFKLTYQFSYLSNQYSDATNVEDGGYSAINGIIPSYTLMDVSVAYHHKWLILEGSVNNLANVPYFTRRATGYPGPGIIPGDGRGFYLTAGVKL